MSCYHSTAKNCLIDSRAEIVSCWRSEQKFTHKNLLLLINETFFLFFFPGAGRGEWEEEIRTDNDDAVLRNVLAKKSTETKTRQRREQLSLSRHDNENCCWEIASSLLQPFSLKGRRRQGAPNASLFQPKLLFIVISRNSSIAPLHIKMMKHFPSSSDRRAAIIKPSSTTHRESH